MSQKIKDISGQKFGKLTAIKIAEDKKNTKGIVWECQCDCGNTVYVLGTLLRSGKTKSCGCSRTEKYSLIGKVFWIFNSIRKSRK